MRSSGDLRKLSAFHRLDVGAEHVDEFVGLHEWLLSRTRRDQALKPRCPDTLMADCDIPVRAAASLTLSPSSLTN